MEAALHIKTKVLPGKKIEVTAPDLIEGEAVEIFVVFPGPGRRGPRRGPAPAQRNLPAQPGSGAATSRGVSV